MLPLTLETNEGVAGALLSMEWHGLGLDRYLQRYHSLIYGVTADDVLQCRHASTWRRKSVSSSWPGRMPATGSQTHYDQPSKPASTSSDRRVRQAIDRHGDRFPQRVYTAGELACCGQRVRSLSRTLCRKEGGCQGARHGIWQRRQLGGYRSAQGRRDRETPQLVSA